MADEHDKEDRGMSQQLSSSWAAFAKTGNPNVSGQVAWPQYNLKNDVMREFNQGQNGLVHDLEKDRVDYQIRTLRALYKTD
jgi:para-nitrobenzyl esterase